MTRGVDIHFEDTQDIQVLQDKSLQAAHFLNSDQVVLRNMENTFRLLPPEAVYQLSHEPSPLYNLLVEFDLERKRIENIIQRLNATVALVR